MENRHRSRTIQSGCKNRGWIRLLGLLIPFVLSIKLLVACSSQPVSLSLVLSDNETDYWRPLIAQFEAQHPTIRIEVANDLLQEDLDNADQIKAAYISAFDQGKPYDLI